MRRLTTALALCAALPASALELDNMTAAERDAFRAEVRAYLLDNPEVLMEAIGVLEERQAAAEAQMDVELARANADALFEDGFSFVGGNPDGDITIVEFFDYRCGFCKRAHPEVAELIETDGNIRYIAKEFPILGEQSMLASRFAIAVKNTEGAEAYKLVSDALMTQRSDVTEAGLIELADTLGLDATSIIAAMDDESVTREIEETRMLAQRLNISGTPTFVFEDQMLRGYAPLDVMEQVIEDLRAEG